MLFYRSQDNEFGYSDVGFASDMKHINSEIVVLTFIEKF
jgi:hypothetical protein